MGAVLGVSTFWMQIATKVYKSVGLAEHIVRKKTHGPTT